MKSKGRQLFSLTSPDFELPFFVDARGRLSCVRADQIPVIHWPNGSWCHPANRFIRELYERGLSRRDKGGTLATYAANISHLIRFCWRTRIDPIDLGDNDFVEFVHGLMNEVRESNPSQMARNATSVIAIGRNCLDFLGSVGRHAGEESFVSASGRIRADQRKFEKGIAGKGGISRLYWHHRCFPQPSAKKQRLPISSDAIDRLRAAIAADSPTPSLRKRRYITLKLLEITGARRGEIAMITVEAVRKAALMERPMLLVPGIKQPGGKIVDRLVPITRLDAKFLVEYIQVNRPVALRRLGRGVQDHGLLLVSDTTGRPLKPQTVTSEVSGLAKAAGLRERACPHLFRHRFITKLFVALIEQHNSNNADEFRRLLLDSNVLRQKVAEWTGHRSLASLDPYIHLAFDEVANFKKSYSVVRIKQIVESLAGTLDQAALELSSGDPPSELVRQLIEMVGECKNELLEIEAA